MADCEEDDRVAEDLLYFYNDLMEAARTKAKSFHPRHVTTPQPATHTTRTRTNIMNFNDIDFDSAYDALAKSGGGGSTGDGLPPDLIGKRLLFKTVASSFKIKKEDDTARLSIKLQPSTAGGYIRNEEERVAAEAALVQEAGVWMSVQLPGKASQVFKTVTEDDKKKRTRLRLVLQNLDFRLTEETAQKRNLPRACPESPRRAENGAKVYTLGGRPLTQAEAKTAFEAVDRWVAAALVEILHGVGQAKNKTILSGYWLTASTEVNGEYLNTRDERSAGPNDKGPGEFVELGSDGRGIPF